MIVHSALTVSANATSKIQELIDCIFQVTEVVILREDHQHVRNSELVSDGSRSTPINNESSWKTFTYPPLPVEEEIGILEQLKPPS